MYLIIANIKQEPVEPVDDPRIILGHREVVCPLSVRQIQHKDTNSG